MIKVCTPFFWPAGFPIPEFQCDSGIRELVKTGRFKEHRMLSTYIPEGRNLLAKDCEGYSHILFVDTDITFTLADVEKLISHKRSIVAADYEHCIEKRGNAYVIKDGEKRYPVGAKGLQKVGGCGFGLMLIECSVFDEMEYPWFYQPRENGKLHGEDYTFCKDTFHDVWVDFDIKVKHEKKGEANMTENKNIPGDSGPARIALNRLLGSLTSVTSEIIKVEELFNALGKQDYDKGVALAKLNAEVITLREENKKLKELSSEEAKMKVPDGV